LEFPEVKKDIKRLSSFVLSAPLAVEYHDDTEQRFGQVFSQSDSIEMKILGR
jgi:hypothetical protein